ncbi:hypothetical protein NE237_029542 [Protea cynaroides]|uniref:Uncharacterized protein n=1 Tax=Protea cynaroides TaxID=273540 RepID=A0A9Q0GSG9_9MAGN|nr:hypothetical protein NE237_029542 [Protea cynaroides]
MQTNQNFPRHVPLQFVDAISGTCMQTLGPDMTFPASTMHKPGEAHGNPNMFINPTASASTEQHSNISNSSVHQSLPTFPPPLHPICNNQDSYQSFLNFSATCSSLCVSVLLQNPAAHAAACLAASF